MADASLDDFFAKKDKSKKKTKPKPVVGDAATNQTIMARKIKKKKEEKQSSTTNSGPVNSEFYFAEAVQSNLLSLMKEDLEWKDYELETEKDYSGLRIQNLQIKPEDDDGAENDYNNENDENNENGGERRENNSGPWNKSGRSTTPPPPQAAPPVVKEEEPSPSEEAPTPQKSVGRYIPPGQRGQSSSSNMTTTEARMARIRNSKKEAPNIHCEYDFPSLGGAANDNDGSGYDRVRSGNRNYEDQSSQLRLNNKYKALQD